MSYYENRIKALEEKVADMSRMQRMKAIPVEAKLVQRIAELQAENKALRKAGDACADAAYAHCMCQDCEELRDQWRDAKRAAKEGKQS